MVGLQFDDFAVLPWQEVVEGQQSRDALEEEGELLP
jgi:hypothetical protein